MFLKKKNNVHSIISPWNSDNVLKWTLDCALCLYFVDKSYLLIQVVLLFGIERQFHRHVISAFHGISQLA